MDWSAENALGFFQEMGWVFLEDATILRPLFPDVPCYKDLPVFHHELWETFSAEVRFQHYETEDNPLQVLLTEYPSLLCNVTIPLHFSAALGLLDLGNGLAVMNDGMVE